MTKITPVSWEHLKRLGVDERDRLYWDNRPVITEEKIT